MDLRLLKNALPALETSTLSNIDSLDVIVSGHCKFGAFSSKITWCFIEDYLGMDRCNLKNQRTAVKPMS